MRQIPKLPTREIRRSGLVLLLLLLLGLNGCGSQNLNEGKERQSDQLPAGNREEVLRLSLATAAEVDSEEMTRRMSDFTDGGIQLLVYGAGLLGGDDTIIQGARIGTISIVYGSTAGQVDAVSQLAFLDIPYLFQDVERANDILNGPLMEWMQPYYQEAGLQLLSWNCNSFRNLTSRTPIYAAEDLRGWYLRIMDNQYHQVFWSRFGALPVVIPFEDLQYALKMGKVEGQENSIFAVTNSGLYTGQSYLIMTEHLPQISTYVMNLEQYQALSPGQQQQLSEFFQMLSQESTARQDLQVSETMAFLRDQAGLEIIYPSDAFLQELYSGRETVMNRVEQALGSELLEEFLTVVQSSAG